MMDALTTVELYQTLSAVLQKTGPVELTEDEIRDAPLATIEASEDGRSCVLRPGEQTT